MIKTIGACLAFIAVFFDFMSYYRQIAKTLATRHSKDVSTRAYMAKLLHYLCSTISLAIFANWLGFGMEAAAGLVCLICFMIVVRYKPKNWKLFQ